MRIVRIERHQRIGLGIVGRAAAVGKRIGDHPEIAHHALDAVGRDSDDEVDPVVGLQAALLHLLAR